MQTRKLGEMETKLADLIWDAAPLSTRALTKRCADAFAWKRTTTYTMLRRLCEQGLFENRDGTVYPLVSRADFKGAQGERFVEETFDGSLPQFIAAFSRRRKLSAKEIDALRRLIDSYEEE